MAADNRPPDPSQPFFDPPATPDLQLTQVPTLSITIDNSVQPVMSGYPPGSVLDMAYGRNDPSLIAAQYVQSGELFRLQRGYPYKRAGHMVPVFPQFKTQNVVIQSLASQPQQNSSLQTIVTPKADPNTTTSTPGSSSTIGYPGFTKTSAT